MRDDAAETAAGRARADRMIEAEKAGEGSRYSMSHWRNGGGWRRKAGGLRIRVGSSRKAQLAFAEVVSLFAGFDKAGAIARRLEFDAVLDDGERGDWVMRDRECADGPRPGAGFRSVRTGGAGSLAWR